MIISFLKYFLVHLSMARFTGTTCLSTVTHSHVCKCTPTGVVLDYVRTCHVSVQFADGRQQLTNTRHVFPIGGKAALCHTFQPGDCVLVGLGTSMAGLPMSHTGTRARYVPGIVEAVDLRRENFVTCRVNTFSCHGIVTTSRKQLIKIPYSCYAEACRSGVDGMGKRTQARGQYGIIRSRSWHENGLQKCWKSVLDKEVGTVWSFTPSQEVKEAFKTSEKGPFLGTVVPKSQHEQMDSKVKQQLTSEGQENERERSKQGACGVIRSEVGTAIEVQDKPQRSEVGTAIEVQDKPQRSEVGTAIEVQDKPQRSEVGTAIEVQDKPQRSEVGTAIEVQDKPQRSEVGTAIEVQDKPQRSEVGTAIEVQDKPQRSEVGTAIEVQDKPQRSEVGTAIEVQDKPQRSEVGTAIEVQGKPQRSEVGTAIEVQDKPQRSEVGTAIEVQGKPQRSEVGTAIEVQDKPQRSEVGTAIEVQGKPQRSEVGTAIEVQDKPQSEAISGVQVEAVAGGRVLRQEGPQEVQDGPQEVQDGPQGVQDGPQGVQDGPQGVQDGPQGVQDGPQGVQDGPQGVQDGPQGVQDGPQGVQDGPQGVQDGPQGVQDGPQGVQEGPQKIKTTAGDNAVGDMICDNLPVQPGVEGTSVLHPQPVEVWRSVSSLEKQLDNGMQQLGGHLDQLGGHLDQLGGQVASLLSRQVKVDEMLQRLVSEEQSALATMGGRSVVRNGELHL